MIDREQIESALARVYDPCSVQANAPLSVVAMGLVTQIRLDADGTVHIALRPTSPWCTMIGSIMQGVEDQLRQLAGVADVTVRIDRESTWCESDLTAEGRQIGRAHV